MRAKRKSFKSWLSRFLIAGLAALPIQFVTFTPSANAIGAPGSINFSTTSQQYLTVPGNNAFYFDRGDFTIEGWVYQNDASGGDLVEMNDGGGSYLIVGVAANGTWRMVWNNGNVRVAQPNSGIYSTTLNSWNHFALVRRGDLLTLYVNGKAFIAASGVLNDSMGYSDRILGIGADPMTGGNRGNYKLADIRIVKGSAIYTHGQTLGVTYFSPPGSNLAKVPGTQLLLSTPRGANYLLDSSDNGFTVTNIGSRATSNNSSPYPDNYSVTYQLGGAVGTAPTQANVNVDASFTTAAAPSRSGYTFDGWNDGSSNIAASSSYTMGSSPLTLTAQWTADLHTVSYSVAGASSTVPTQSDVATDSTFTTAATPTKLGFTFSGWSDGTNVYSASTSYQVGLSDVVLTATWSQNVYSVNFDSRNNNPDVVSQVSHGNAVALPTAPTWYGYNFKGWSETTNGVVLDLSTVTINSAKTFYGIWEQKSLAGLSNLSSPNILTPDASNDQTVITSRGTTSTSVKVPAGALPSTYSVKVYTLSDNSLATQALGANNTYIISQVVAWSHATDGTIQDTAVGKPIEMTITSPDIKTGAKVYSILDNVSTLLATATQDGSVTATFSVDPVIVVQAAPVVAPPGGGGGGSYIATPTPSPTASKPPVLTSARSFNILGFNPGSWTLTKSIKKSIDAFFKSINKPNKISCVGYTMGPTVLRVDYNLAMRRGQEVCNYVVAKNPSIAKMTTKGTTTKISDGKYRRTTINWTE